MTLNGKRRAHDSTPACTPPFQKSHIHGDRPWVV
jgi:hypothetical protein